MRGLSVWGRDWSVWVRGLSVWGRDWSVWVRGLLVWVRDWSVWGQKSDIVGRRCGSVGLVCVCVWVGGWV